jgi:3-deoxy-7-phosphoheptulonate synthase
MKAIGVDTRAPTFTQCNFYTAHECLLLPYEEALTRQDSITDRWYIILQHVIFLVLAFHFSTLLFLLPLVVIHHTQLRSPVILARYDCSSHMLWVGERTRQLDHAHTHFVAGINNPIGVKISDKCTPEELISIIDTINPDNIPGRVTIIVRMGAEKLRANLPKLIRAVQREGRTVLWISDPVHGNTVKSSNGFKTRPFERIRDELRAFFDVHAEMGTHPGGVHLEMTGENVTECTGGNVGEVSEEDLNLRYHTYCDPRLNGNQALELAFLIAERMRLSQGLAPLFNCPI